ncbi:hypothetical protein Tco_0316538 [Tanacetum coccineum]
MLSAIASASSSFEYSWLESRLKSGDLNSSRLRVLKCLLDDRNSHSGIKAMMYKLLFGDAISDYRSTCTVSLIPIDDRFNNRYVVPTGRVKVPAGRYVVPTGKDKFIVSAGRTKVIPAGSTILVLAYNDLSSAGTSSGIRA